LPQAAVSSSAAITARRRFMRVGRPYSLLGSVEQ
jgi:hypothetical protein